MANLGYTFDPSTAPKDERSFDPVPTGWYVAQIIESDVVPTKDGAGLRLKLTFEIIDGPFMRRRIWTGLNIQNRSAQAQELAQRDLRSICEAVGWRGELTDSASLEFKPCEIRVGVQRDDATKNEVKAYRSVNGPQAQAQAQPQAQPQQHRQAPQQAASQASRPWARSA